LPTASWTPAGDVTACSTSRQWTNEPHAQRAFGPSVHMKIAIQLQVGGLRRRWAKIESADLRATGICREFHEDQDDWMPRPDGRK